MAQAMEAAIGRIQALAKASHALTRDEIREVHQLCEVGRATFKIACDSLVIRADHGTMLQFCMADGTPTQVSDHVEESLPTGRVIQRAGKSSFEFLCAAQFHRRAKPEGSVEDAVCVCEILLH